VGVAGSGAVAVNATGFGNVINNSVSSCITGGSEVITGSPAGDIKLDAKDTSLIRSAAISVAGTGGIAAGALIGANVITNSVITEISSSTVESGSKLELTSENKSSILGLSVGVAASGAGAGILSLTGNVITNTTRAAITGEETSRSDIDATGAINLTANDTSEINTLAIGVAGTGGGAVGAALAANVIINSAETLINNSDVDTDSTLIMDSSNSPLSEHWQ
jgi:hypothetical protein